MQKTYDSVLETIGGTPLIRLSKLTAGLKCTVLAKLESRNPGSSVKDRTCLSMIDEAEKRGRFNHDKVIIEPTRGNRGIGLAMVAAVKGYRLILTMPETMSDRSIIWIASAIPQGTIVTIVRPELNYKGINSKHSISVCQGSDEP